MEGAYLGASDPYGDGMAWRSELLQMAETFLEADDALRQANQELKPYRQKKKEGKSRVESLMEKHRLDQLAFEERNETLVLTHRQSKRRPTAEQIHDRCVSFLRGDAAAGKKLFEFLFRPVVEEVASLRRKKGVLGPSATETATGVEGV